jgi:hypothetical protein
MSTDKGSISALRLTKLIGVSWLTAHRMLRKLRVAMGGQNRLYRLEGIIELDDAFQSVASEAAVLAARRPFWWPVNT